MLRLVPKAEKLDPIPALKHLGPEAYVHHRQLFEGYLQSHITRNHSERTIAELKRYLTGWFNEQGGGLRPLYVWEAMEPMQGRRRIVEYGKGLVQVELENSTIRRYLGQTHDPDASGLGGVLSERDRRVDKSAAESDKQGPGNNRGNQIRHAFCLLSFCPPLLGGGSNRMPLFFPKWMTSSRNARLSSKTFVRLH